MENKTRKKKRIEKLPVTLTTKPEVGYKARSTEVICLEARD
jgi:hypothetical protein